MDLHVVFTALLVRVQCGRKSLYKTVEDLAQDQWSSW